MSTVYHNGSIPVASLVPNIDKILFNPPNEEISFYEEVSPLLAKNILQNHNFANQRPVRIRHVKKLADAILDDKFRPVSPITFALNDALKVVNVNGQHTLHAIVKSNKTTRLLINFTPETAKDVYTVIDNHNKRTVFDAVKAIGDWEGVLHESDFRYFGSAAKILYGFNVHRVEDDPYKIQSTMEKYISSYITYKKSIVGTGASGEMSSKLLARIPTAVGVALHHYAPEMRDKINLFFYSVATGDCKPRTVERLLHDKYLVGRATSWGRNGSHEIKDILLFWRYSNIGRKQVRAGDTLKYWQMSPNLHGTDITFSDA